MPRRYDRLPFLKSAVEQRVGNGCIEWPYAIDKGGYGMIEVGPSYAERKKDRVHRLSYKLFVGPIPADKPFVLHKCDNQRCFNPDHLFVGTQLENVQDRVQKRRTAKGEAAGAVKLSTQDVLWIKQTFADKLMSQHAMARICGVTATTVRAIIIGKIWKHLDAD